MRASMSLAGLFCFAIAASSSAAPTDFPYEAVVENDDVVVRSGPGERYDPTLKLTTGQRVTVQRHDPGGWFMISPPAGSFSWIDGTYVQKTGPETGVVKVASNGDGLPPRVVVWIGSQFTDEHKYFGRQLANGDEVQILGEEQRQTERGMTTFYRIAPPRLEYRWVKGDFIVPLAEAGNIARSAPVSTPPVSSNPGQVDPFRGGLSNTQAMPAPGFPPEQGPTLLERDLTRGINAGAVAKSPSASTSTVAERTKLYELDDQLKTMLAQTPNHWDLVGMEQSYLQLQATAGPGVAAQADARLAAIGARKKIKAEYDAFVGVITQTEQTDAALLSMQQAIASGVPLSEAQVELGMSTGFPQQQMGPPALPGQPESSPSPLLPPNPMTPGSEQTGLPQIDGAGIIQRLTRPVPGLPQYALVAPDGRLLAYLSAGQSVQLNQYVGKSMGVIGQRSHNARLRGDVIVVERLTPVQLQP